MTFDDIDDTESVKGKCWGAQGFEKDEQEHISDAVFDWKERERTTAMLRSLQDVMSEDDPMNVIDGGLAKGPHYGSAGDLLWNWAPTVRRKSTLDLVQQKKNAGLVKGTLDAGMGLFAGAKIDPMRLVAILEQRSPI
jgi:hypothetical protein